MSAAWISSFSGWPSTCPQAHRVFQQQIAGVDAQRPVEVAVADDHEPGLRMVLEDGRHRLDQQVRPVALVQVADEEDRRVDRADLVARLDRAGIELASRTVRRGTACAAGTMRSAHSGTQYRATSAVAGSWNRIGCALRAVPLGSISSIFWADLAGQVAALPFQASAATGRLARFVDAAQQRQGRDRRPLEAQQRHRAGAGGKLLQEGVARPGW